MGGEEGTACKDAIAFIFFRPPYERRNPDWSDFKNYSIRRSDWSATCHSGASVFSHSFKFKILADGLNI